MNYEYIGMWTLSKEGEAAESQEEEDRYILWLGKIDEDGACDEDDDLYRLQFPEHDGSKHKMYALCASLIKDLYTTTKDKYVGKGIAIWTE